MISLLTGITIAKETKKAADEISTEELIAKVEQLARVVNRSRGLIERFERVATNVEPADQELLVSQLALAAKLVNNLEKRFAKIMTGVNIQRKKGLPSAQKQLQAPIRLGGFGRNAQLLVIEDCVELLEEIFNGLQSDSEIALPSVYKLPVPSTGIPYQTAA